MKPADAKSMQVAGIVITRKQRLPVRVVIVQDAADTEIAAHYLRNLADDIEKGTTGSVGGGRLSSHWAAVYCLEDEAPE